MITYSAIRYKGKIYTGKRHHNCFQKMWELGVENSGGREEQGFIDDKGRFLNREEALVVAMENKQIIKKHPPYSMLFSEDIFEDN